MDVSGGDLTGALIANKYELIRLLGRGGMGSVYEARNISTLKRCAVKLLRNPELVGDDEVVRRFFREARASGLIESEHVVAAFDSGIDAASRAYYVMECLEGEDLQQLLRRAGPLSPRATMKIVMHAAEGLACAHALGIVHRDVKPANLFLSLKPGQEIKVKILDFGVAKVKMDVFHESSHSLTRTGSMLGTPLYMSPEQVKRASAIDESADVWSLGVVMFEALSGKLPWGEVESVGELLAAILTLDIPPLQDSASWVQPELAEIVHRLLSRDANHRLRNAAQLRDELANLLRSDRRLFQDELTTISEAERSVAAVRLSLADTILMPAGANVGSAMTRSIVPAKKRGPAMVYLGSAVVAAATVGGVGWKVIHTSSPAGTPESSAQSATAPPAQSAEKALPKKVTMVAESAAVVAILAAPSAHVSAATIPRKPQRAPTSESIGGAPGEPEHAASGAAGSVSNSSAAGDGSTLGVRLEPVWK